MPANTSPIFSLAPDVQWTAANIVTANTTKDGTTGTPDLLFTADATNGGRVEKIIVRPIGANAATVMRVFLNNGLTLATRANNTLIAELAMPTVALSESAAQASFELPLDIAIPPGFRLYVTIGTTIAAGISVTAIGSKY